MLKVFVKDNEVVKACIPEYADLESIPGAVIYDYDGNARDHIIYENGNVALYAESTRIQTDLSVLNAKETLTLPEQQKKEYILSLLA